MNRWRPAVNRRPAQDETLMSVVHRRLVLAVIIVGVAAALIAALPALR